LRYRFSGYQLPLLQWDETGPAWIKLPPHPYFRNQPILWQDAWSFGMPAYSFTVEVYAPGQRVYGPDGITMAPLSNSTEERTIERTRNITNKSNQSKGNDNNDNNENNTLIKMLPF